MRRFHLGDKVKAITGPTGRIDNFLWYRLCECSWFQKHRYDIMTIKMYASSNTYYVKENTCIWNDSWLQPMIEEELLLEKELFEI